MIVRRRALAERGVDPAAFWDAMEGESPLAENDDMLSFGPLFGEEALTEYSRRPAALGLIYIDDFHGLNFDLPEWLAVSLRFVAKQSDG